MALMLVILSEGKWQGKTLAITRFPFLVGRGPDCQLRPNSSLVSRRQCGLVDREGRFFLQDFGSTNGTLINGRTLRGGEIELLDGDQVTVGPLELQVRIAGEAATRPAGAGAAGASSDTGPAAAPSGAEDPEATWANLLLAAPDKETVPEATGVQSGAGAGDATEVDLSQSGTAEEGQPMRRRAPKGETVPGTTGAVAKELLRKYRQSMRKE
jgi:predicted component of type VI protein secretion system